MSRVLHSTLLLLLSSALATWWQPLPTVAACAPPRAPPALP